MSKINALAELRKSLVRQMDKAREDRLHSLDRMDELVRRQREQVEDNRFYQELNIGNLAAEIARYAETMFHLDRQIVELDAVAMYMGNQG